MIRRAILSGMNIEIPIFQAGTHTAMSGDERAFTDADLAATASAYDPALFDAPAVIGHPEHNGPAWGWVESLAIKGGLLVAKLRDLDASFVEMVRAKRFKKISASFYLPDSPANPKPGVFYLRHVGFLGAAAPALKTLPAVNLSETDGALIYEETMYYHPAANLMQSGQNDPLNHTENNTMSGKQNDDIETIKAQMAALEAENTKLKTQSSEFQEQVTVAQTQLAERERAAKHESHVAFCDKLVNEGRLLPVTQAVAVAALDLIAAQEKPLEFSEGDGKVQLTVDKFKSALSGFPKIVDFSERSKDDGKSSGKAANLNVPSGFQVDPKAAALHSKALSYIEQHPGTEYVAAVAAVERVTA